METVLTSPPSGVATCPFTALADATRLESDAKRMIYAIGTIVVGDEHKRSELPFPSRLAETMSAEQRQVVDAFLPARDTAYDLLKATLLRWTAAKEQAAVAAFDALPQFLTQLRGGLFQIDVCFRGGVPNMVVRVMQPIAAAYSVPGAMSIEITVQEHGKSEMDVLGCIIQRGRLVAVKSRSSDLRLPLW